MKHLLLRSLFVLPLLASIGLGQMLFAPYGTVGTASNWSMTFFTGAKGTAPSGGQGQFVITSNESSYQLQGIVSLVTDPTGSNRRLTIQAIEQGVAWRNVTLAESGGNVGIGTNNPLSTLDVNGNIRFGNHDTANPRYIGWTINNGFAPTNFVGMEIEPVAIGGNYSENVYFGTHYFGVSAGQRMMIRYDGNVGIGTSTPGAKLDVYQAGGISVINMTSSSSAGFVSALVGYGSNSASATTYYGGYYSGISSNTAGAESGYLSLYTRNAGAWSEKVRVDNAGNVGIGTANPTYPLTVNGTVRAKEVIVDTGWSDYVFADDYKLPALSETEAAIKSEKHLPGIPSAKDVAEHGISVGEIQAKLLAKIEELTLHQIEQEKREARLTQRVEQLEKENQNLRAHISP